MTEGENASIKIGIKIGGQNKEFFGKIDEVMTAAGKELLVPDIAN